MLVPETVAAVMNTVGVWWAVAGGWAIDLWLGEQTRPHHDIEAVVGSADQPTVHAAFQTDWQLYCIDPPGSGWRRWNGDPIDRPAFQLQARSTTMEFDLFVEAIDGSTWTFRRDDRIRLPVEQLATVSRSGVPIVRPEVQLLYMARSAEPKHVHDFDLVQPTLDADARSWLADALRTTIPSHPWLERL